MSAGTDELAELGARLAEHDEPQLTPDEFKAVFRLHAAGVAVVTLRDGESPVGFTATSVISVSAEPPLFAFSIASESSSWPALSRAKTLAVSFLAEGQAEASARFATHGIDRFAGGGWTALPSGEPVVDDALAWIQGRVVQRIPVGDSYLVTVRALDQETRPDASPLVYRDRSYHLLAPQ